MTTQHTPIANLPYPDLTDAPNVPSSIGGLATALDTVVIPKFATTTLRDSAIPTPSDGQMIYRSDLKSYEFYSSGTGWLPVSVGSFASSTARDAAYASPTDGVRVYRSDLHGFEYYNSAHGASGAASGWRANAGLIVSEGTLGSAASAISFTSIPQNASHIRIYLCGKTSSNTGVNITTNGTGSYSASEILVNSAGTAAGANGATNSILWNNCLGTQVSSMVIDVPFYSSATLAKTFYGLSTQYAAALPVAANASYIHFGARDSSAALTTITITTQAGTFNTGYSYGLYLAA